MVFGIGAERSRSNSYSRQDASSYGYTSSVSSERSESQSRSLSGSEQASQTGSQTSQSIAYSPIFEALFRGASGAAATAAENVPAVIAASNKLFSSGQGFLSALETGGPGASYLESRISGDSGVADARIEQLGADIGRFLSTEVNPAIVSRGVQAGTLGGDRGQVARGEASRAALDEFSRGAVSIRGEDQAARDAAAGALLSSSAARSSAGLSAIPSLQGVLEAGAYSALDPYAGLAGILGPQTVLTQGESQGVSSGSSFGRSSSDALSIALARAFGEDFSQSSGYSVGSSSSGGFSLGF